MGRHEQGTVEEPNVRARRVAQESKWMDVRDTLGLDLVKCVPQARRRIQKGEGPRSGSRRRSACISAGPLPRTFADRLLRRALGNDAVAGCGGASTVSLVKAVGNRQGIKAVGMTMEVMSKCAFKSPCRHLFEAVHGDDILLGWLRRLVSAVRESPRERYETRE